MEKSPGTGDASERPNRTGPRAAGPSLVLLNGFAYTAAAGSTLLLPVTIQRLLAFLALRDRPPSRIHLASTLWPNLTEERASANLRSTMWRLRQRGCAAVESPGEDVKLAQEVEVDVYGMVQLAHEILGGSDPVPGWHAIAPLTGELLPDWDDEWVRLERERLRQLRLHALEALSEQLTGVGRLPESIEVAVAAVAIDPLRESARRALVRAHLAEGNLAEAFRQYEDYRTLLSDELGLDPTPMMQGLIRETWAS